MTAIAFDRFFCICYVHKNLITVNKAKVITVLLFVTSCLLGIIPALNSVIKINHLETNSSNASIEFFLCYVDTETKSDYFDNLVLPFKNFYDLIYLVSVILVTGLYIAIYKEIRVKNRIKAERIRKFTINNSMNKDVENKTIHNNCNIYVNFHYF